MSNFINGRERLWLPKSSVKDSSGEGGGRWWAKGTTGRETEGGERERDAKCERERGEESLGLVVNGYNWLREAGPKWERERLERWKDEEGRFPTSWVSTSITLSLSLHASLHHSLPSSISVSYQPQCGILSHQISSSPERRFKLLCQSYLKHIWRWGHAPFCSLPPSVFLSVRPCRSLNLGRGWSSSLGSSAGMHISPWRRKSLSIKHEGAGEDLGVAGGRKEGRLQETCINHQPGDRCQR